MIFNKSIRIAFESYNIWSVCLATVMQAHEVSYQTQTIVFFTVCLDAANWPKSTNPRGQWSEGKWNLNTMSQKIHKSWCMCSCPQAVFLRLKPFCSLWF